MINGMLSAETFCMFNEKTGDKNENNLEALTCKNKLTINQM
jgi:hypothetical protein